MALYTRPAKAVSGGGSTSYVDGNKLPASELNADFDGIVNVLNANIDEDNLSVSTQIPNDYLVDIGMEKVLDYADSISVYKLTTTPGDTASPSLPATLLQEMVRVRHRIGANKGYSSTVYYMEDNGTPTTAAWFEPRLCGPNLLPNPGFEVHSAGTPNAPDSWTLMSTPATVAIENPAHAAIGLEKRSLNIVANGNDEGIQVTIGGLKASTKYLVGMSYVRTAGTINLVTTDGLATGDYMNLALPDASSSGLSVLQGIVKSNSTPDSMTIQIYGSATGADWNIYDVWMHEVSDGVPVAVPHITTQTASDSSASTGMTGWTGTGNAWRTDTLTSLSLTQYVPCRGYRMVYEVSVPVRAADESNEGIIAYCAIQLNIDGGGASTVFGPQFYETHIATSNGGCGHTFVMRHVVDNPTPGSSYAFTTLLGAYDAADYADVIVSPSVNAVQMAANARLIMERI